MKPETIRRVSGAVAEPWRVEKRVPIAVIFAVAMQIFTLVVWGAWLEARVATLERGRMQEASLPERFARLEERMDAVREDLVRLRERLEKK